MLGISLNDFVDEFIHQCSAKVDLGIYGPPYVPIASLPEIVTPCNQMRIHSVWNFWIEQLHSHKIN